MRPLWSQLPRRPTGGPGGDVPTLCRLGGQGRKGPCSGQGTVQVVPPRSRGHVTATGPCERRPDRPVHVVGQKCQWSHGGTATWEAPPLPPTRSTLSIPVFHTINMMGSLETRSLYSRSLGVPPRGNRDLVHSQGCQRAGKRGKYYKH